MMLLAPLSGLMSDKFSSGYLAFSGSFLSAVALFSMVQLTIFSDYWDVLWRFGLLGVGAALFQSPNNQAIVANVPEKKAGMVSSIIVTMRNLGMVFAVSFAGIILSTTLNPDVLQSTALYNLAAYDFASGMHRVVIFGGFISFIMVALSLAGSEKQKLDFEYVKDKMNGLMGK